MYHDELNATLGKKILHYYFIVVGVVAILFSSLYLYLIVTNSPYHVSSGDTIYISLFGIYALGFAAIYIFFKRGYPTSYVIAEDGVKVLFKRRRPVSIPFAVIEKVTLDREGPSRRRFLGGFTYDATAMKSERYVAIRTPVLTYYLSPSNPSRFVTELKRGMSKATTRIKTDMFEGLKEDKYQEGHL